MPVSPVHRSRKRWFLYAAVVAVFAAAVWYFAFRAKPPHNRPAMPAWAGNEYPPRIPVRTVAAKAQDLPVHIKAIGTVTPVNTVTVRSRVSGQLLQIAFEEGQRVQKGDLLAEIDPASYRIQLAQVEGQLRQNQARLSTARADLERIRELHSRKLVTDQELDAQQALVAEREGTVASSQAQVDNARLELAYTRIEAPITGRVGLRRVDPGNLVRESDTQGLVVITQTQPIAVTFTVPEKELQAVLEPLRAGEPLEVEAWDRAETGVLATGTLKTVDNQIDTATGTLRLKAEFANADDRLFPNQFVNVRLRVRTLQNAVVIPAAAVQFGSRGTYVYIVGADNKAAVRDVALGPVDGTLQAVTKGLTVGDQVVLEGLDRLREGRTVVVANEPAPAAVTKP
ncbi:multidrug transporter subunit MdtA [Opitutaceae bacterium EW11]|nr:multidrug transporter subunit MdtA [Opitutaceae bacterium EW11]